MSYIYLIRHAQAGSRDNYDVLSGLGHEQARRLGQHFAEQGIELSTVYSGGMRRQRHTAEIVCEAMARGGLSVPDIVTDERWNEFSLISIYRAIARRLCDESEEFARDFAEMQEALRRDPHTVGGATSRCDIAVIRAWMEHRFPDYEGESWASFRARIESCAAELTNHNSEKAVAVFTSATPVAITAGASLGLSDEKLLKILGVLYNTGVTVMRARGDGLRLFTLNATPHLNDSLKTFR
ncbi:MAG TPA: histidine phosphatase family protein [Blastocatellia bacterium]|nr:histidine phosphatase family protein [Blastocatellia bacterium]